MISGSTTRDFMELEGQRLIQRNTRNKWKPKYNWILNSYNQKHLCINSCVTKMSILCACGYYCVEWTEVSASVIFLLMLLSVILGSSQMIRWKLKTACDPYNSWGESNWGYVPAKVQVVLWKRPRGSALGYCMCLTYFWWFLPGLLWR